LAAGFADNAAEEGDAKEAEDRQARSSLVLESWYGSQDFLSAEFCKPVTACPLSVPKTDATFFTFLYIETK
jgi:hypothetical protein